MTNMAQSRRQFLRRSTSALGVGAAGMAVSSAQDSGPLRSAASRPESPGSAASTARFLSAEPNRPVLISTWPFGKPANEAGLRSLLSGGSILDAVEQGIRVVEADPGNGSVGLGGLPNAAGYVQLDACIMSGPGHKAGSVAALEGIRHPISAARRVLEKSPHVMLVGEGARVFALEQGLESVETRSVELLEAWKRKRRTGSPGAVAPGRGDKPRNHDTIALLVLGQDGHLAGGCSTSGWGGKYPGRVGDSPIPGAGLYVDDEVGGAGATGLGENILRHCASHLVVELMRQGLHPEDACLEALRRISRREPKGTDISISLIAVDRLGRAGAASSGRGFEYALTTRNETQVRQAPALGSTGIGPIGGNRP